MSRSSQVARPILRSLRPAPSCSTPIASRITPIGASRPFSNTPSRRDEGTTTTTTATGGGRAPAVPDEAWLRAQLNPETATSLEAEVKLMQAGTPPIGSRRRRAAIAVTGELPFEQLPYQAFQEARKILQADRQEKLAEIQETLRRIQQVEASDPSVYGKGEGMKEKKLKSLRMRLEKLKILADINDPMVKRIFEDGLGDMSKPIYRYLAERKWRSMDFKIIQQRIDQFNIVPDVLPKFSPKMDVKLYWRGYKISPGAMLNSSFTEIPPSLHMQVFDGGERLLTVVVMDSDVPDAASDGYDTRCHFIATNIPWGPTRTSVPLGNMKAFDASAEGAELNKKKVAGDVAVPWLPPTAQKGAPYHRLSVFVLEHSEPMKPLDPAQLKALYDGKGRAGFTLKAIMQKFKLTPAGFNIFRTEWDANTAAVMERHGIPGADVEFRRQRVHSLKPPRKARGWEARRQGPKYKHLWKYTKRIAPGRGGS